MALSVGKSRDFAPRVYLRLVTTGVTRHHALWCSDFPPPPNDSEEAILRPSKIGMSIVPLAATSKSAVNANAVNAGEPFRLWQPFLEFWRNLAERAAPYGDRKVALPALRL